MSIIDKLLSVLAPYECVGCKTEGGLLCADCAYGLPPADARCYECQRPSPAGRTCGACSPGNPLYGVRSVASYTGCAKQLVAMLKFSGARTASRQMAVMMAQLMELQTGPGGNVPHDVLSDALVVPVPTATGRVRRRGYDQARLLARELAREKHLAFLDCLARCGQTHQVGAGREQRLSQLQGAFRLLPRRAGAVKESRVLLVDDVVTTGASLESAAHVLRAAGAARVEAVTFCAA